MPKVYKSEQDMFDDMMSSQLVTAPRHKKSNDRAAAIYHEMRADDGFEATAEILFGLVREAITKFPGRQRMLYLDIDGHRDGDSFDDAAYEIQNNYVCGFLGQWLHAAHMPLVCWTNAKASDDISRSLEIRKGTSE